MTLRQLYPKDKYYSKEIIIYINTVGKTRKVHLRHPNPFKPDYVDFLVDDNDLSYFIIIINDKMSGNGPKLSNANKGLSFSSKPLFDHLNIYNRKFTAIGKLINVDKKRKGYKVIIPPLGTNEPIPIPNIPESPFKLG